MREYDSRKRILVTDGAGFLGSHLIDRLLGRGHELVCADNLFTGSGRAPVSMTSAAPPRCLLLQQKLLFVRPLSVRLYNRSFHFSLSLQMHRHRSEHWVAINGTAKIADGENEMILEEDESTFVPAGRKH